MNAASAGGALRIGRECPAPRQHHYCGVNQLHYITSNAYRRTRLFHSDRFKLNFTPKRRVLLPRDSAASSLRCGSRIAGSAGSPPSRMPRHSGNFLVEAARGQSPARIGSLGGEGGSQESEDRNQ